MARDDKGRVVMCEIAKPSSEIRFYDMVQEDPYPWCFVDGDMSPEPRYSHSTGDL